MNPEGSQLPTECLDTTSESNFNANKLTNGHDNKVVAELPSCPIAHSTHDSLPRKKLRPILPAPPNYNLPQPLSWEWRPLTIPNLREKTTALGQPIPTFCNESTPSSIPSIRPLGTIPDPSNPLSMVEANSLLGPETCNLLTVDIMERKNAPRLMEKYQKQYASELATDVIVRAMAKYQPCLPNEQDITCSSDKSQQVLLKKLDDLLKLQIGKNSKKRLEFESESKPLDRPQRQIVKQEEDHKTIPTDSLSPNMAVAWKGGIDLNVDAKFKSKTSSQPEEKKKLVTPQVMEECPTLQLVIQPVHQETISNRMKKKRIIQDGSPSVKGTSQNWVGKEKQRLILPGSVQELGEKRPEIMSDEDIEVKPASVDIKIKSPKSTSSSSTITLHLSSTDKEALSSSFWNDFQKLTENVERECCRACGKLDRPLQRHRWIFCMKCGESWHLKCVPDGPSSDQPGRRSLPPGEFEAWSWECQPCRSCDCCSKLGSNQLFGSSQMNDQVTIYRCYYCQQRVCQTCDPHTPSYERGFYYRCPSCRQQRINTCMNCSAKIQSLVAKYCPSCVRKRHCPICCRRYFVGNKEEIAEMIPCLRCHSFTHLECLGIVQKQKDALPVVVKKNFVCIQCRDFNDNDDIKQERPPSNHSQDGWMRRGSLAVFWPRYRRDRILRIRKSIWHPNRPGHRTFCQWQMEMNIMWRATSMTISVDDRSIQAPSMGEAFTALQDLYTEDTRGVISLWSMDKFLSPNLINQLIYQLSTVKIFKDRFKERQIAKAKKLAKTKDVLVSNSSSTRTDPCSKATDNEEADETIGRNDESSRTWGYLKSTKKRNIYYPYPFIASRLEMKIREINGLRATDRPLLEMSKSRIAGNGLYANRTIYADTPIIEYVGEIIGQKEADRREKYYSTLSLFRNDCYLFRLDQDRIIDATLKSNLARFINHSCDSNCESRRENNRIVIYSLRDVEAGEELTYDYKFSKEESEDYACCRCGAPSCRGFMN